LETKRRLVVTDANVLINLILGHLPGYEFFVVDQAGEEITVAKQAEKLAEALSAGWLKQGSLTGVEALQLFANLVKSMGRGEAASLAFAHYYQSYIACDEKRVFRREAFRLLGERRILTTPGILLLAIRAGLLTADRADAMKATLEAKRFRMSFSSFRDVL